MVAANLPVARRQRSCNARQRSRLARDAGGNYNNWQEYDPEDTIRFYSLRLDEAGLIKSSPQKIIADGTDWRHTG